LEDAGYVEDRVNAAKQMTQRLTKQIEEVDSEFADEAKEALGVIIDLLGYDMAMGLLMNLKAD